MGKKHDMKNAAYEEAAKKLGLPVTAKQVEEELEEAFESVDNTEDWEASEDAEALEEFDDTEDWEEFEDEEEFDDTEDGEEFEDEEELEGPETWRPVEELDDEEVLKAYKAVRKMERTEETEKREAELKARLDGMFADMMRRTFSHIIEEDYANRPKKFPKAPLSAEFESRMNQLLYDEPEPEPEKEKASRLSSLLALFRPVRNRRAIVVMAALMMLLVGMTAGGANPIILWLHDSWMEQHGDYVEIESREEETKTLEEISRRYELAEVPDGYRIIEEYYYEKVGIYYMDYADEEGNVIVFEQSRKENENLGNITANRKDIEPIKVNDLEGYYVKDSDAENLVLSDGEYMLVFSGNLSKDQFIELAEGLRRIE